VARDSEFLMLFSSTEMLSLTDNDDLAWVDVLFMCVMIDTSMSSGGDGDTSKVLLLHHILL
jgi:hypothetical protein